MTDLGLPAKIGILSCSLFTLAIAAGLVFPTWTPRIKGQNSISMLKQVDVNGAGHEVMIRGADRRNPVLIFVHGGPGCSEIPYIREYQDLLEKHFTIVHYDQRGSGKSYHFFEDYSRLSSDLLVDDLLALTDYVAEELKQPKVLLAGHSFGTYIGMKAAARQINDTLLYYKGFLLNPEYNLTDVIRYAKGALLSQRILLKEESAHPITGLVQRVEIPCYFAMGKYDYMTSTRAARNYFDKLEAPKKEFAVFENSAHYPQLEEKERFAEWLVNLLEEL